MEKEPMPQHETKPEPKPVIAKEQAQLELAKNSETEILEKVKEAQEKIFAEISNKGYTQVGQFLRKAIEERTAYKDAPEATETQITYERKTYTASYNPTKGMEIYPGIADKRRDLSHIIYHESGHALIESSIVEIDDYYKLCQEHTESSDQAVPIPREVYSKYIQNEINRLETQNQSKNGNKELNDQQREYIHNEILAEFIAAFLKSDSLESFAFNYLAKGIPETWKEYLDEQIKSQPNLQLKTVQEKIDFLVEKTSYGAYMKKIYDILTTSLQDDAVAKQLENAKTPKNYDIFEGDDFGSYADIEGYEGIHGIPGYSGHENNNFGSSGAQGRNWFVDLLNKIL